MIAFKPLTTMDEWFWFASRTSVIRCEDSQGIVAYNSNGRIGAICVFDTWCPNSVNVHLAIDDPFTIRRGLFTEVAVHGFIRGNKKRFFGLVPECNDKALRLNEKIGFRRIAHIPDALDDGVGYVVMRLDKEDCRWLPEIFRGQRDDNTRNEHDKNVPSVDKHEISV